MNSSNLDDHRFALPSQSPGAVIADMTLLSVAILFGFVGNVPVCFVLKKRQDLRKVPHFLFTSLAVNGIFSSLVHLPSRLAMNTFYYHLDNSENGEQACNVWAPSNLFCAIVNAVTLSLMAIDRQDCVLRPFNRRMTPNNIIVFIVLSWIGALLLSSVIIFYAFFGETVCHQLDPDGFFANFQEKRGAFVYLVGLINSINIISFLIVAITAIRIIKRLRSSPLPDSASLHRRQENKLTWLTYKICGVFFACWLPPLVAIGLSQFGGIRNDTITDVVVITTSTSNFHYVVNPLLFYNDLVKSRTVPVNNIPRPVD